MKIWITISTILMLTSSVHIEYEHNQQLPHSNQIHKLIKQVQDSKQPMNHDQLLQKISKTTGGTLGKKPNNAVRDRRYDKSKFSTSYHMPDINVINRRDYIHDL